MKTPSIPLNVRTKILALFLALALTSLIVTGFVALYAIGEFGATARQDSARLGMVAVKDSTAALLNATGSAMIRMAGDQALLIDEIFWSTELELDLLAAHAQSVQHNPFYQPLIRSSPLSTPPQNRYDATLAYTAPGATVSETEDEYRALAGMDDLLAAVYRSDGDLTSVYVATESGLLRTYPWDGALPPGYDPRGRDWYRMARASDRPVWTEPYRDASGHGLIVTCARSVRTTYGTWVVASDVTTHQLSHYTNLSLGGKGFAVIVDENGTIVSRPGLGAAGDESTYIPENIFSGNYAGVSAVVTNMTAQNPGIGTVVINEVPTFVAWAPIESLNWTYAVFLPVDEVTAPVRHTEGEILAATQATDALIGVQIDRIMTILAVLVLLILVIVSVLSWFLARMITRPVDQLREGATALGSGDLSYRVDILSGDEFEELAGSFNRMADDLKVSIENLKITTAKNERYIREMEIAKEIQDTFLPGSVPDIAGYDIAAANYPAMEIGGDLYDFITLPEGSRAFVIADVSGKGVSAALYMALSQTLLHASGSGETDPSRAVWNANRLICEDDRSGMFITVFYGVLDPEKMALTYVNAGHNPPLLVRADGSVCWLDQAKGIALGVLPEVAISPATHSLAPGDVLVLYTDGVTEAFNEQDDDFGEERMADVVVRHRSLPATEILSSLLSEIRVFAGAAPQSDDITLVIIRVT